MKLENGQRACTCMILNKESLSLRLLQFRSGISPQIRPGRTTRKVSR